MSSDRKHHKDNISRCMCVCTVGVGIRMWAGSYNLNKVIRDGLIQKVTCQ